MNKKILKLENKHILESLEDNNRQYLVGLLKRPQILNHIEDEKIEIGITSYDEFICEMPHTHSQAFEYQYMISGYTKYLDTETGEEYEFRKGDFYVISPGIKYAQKSKPKTKILFIKTPSGNDKINIEPNEYINEWLKEKIKTIRKDYRNQDNSPKPNSIKPAAAVAITNNKNEILLLKRKDSGKWTMPGGTHEFGESLKSCALREVQEETGYSINIADIIGTYTNPNTVIEYSDGEVRQEFTIVYKGEIIDGNIRIDDESTGYKWLKIDEALKLDIADSQRIRLDDVKEYLETGSRAFK